MSSQSKVDFYHSVIGEGPHHVDDPSISAIKISPTSYYREVAMTSEFVFIDFATWIRAIREPEKQECGYTTEIMGQSVQKLLDRKRMRKVFLVMDKDQVLMGKGPTQNQRKEAIVSLSASAKKAQIENGMSNVVREASRMALLPATIRECIPSGMTLEEARRAGHITLEAYDKVMKGEALRQQRLNKHEDSVAREQAAMQENVSRTTLLDSDIPIDAFRHANVELDTHKLNMLEKALVAVHRTLLPQPWGKMVGTHRDIIMRYVCRQWITGLRTYLSPKPGTELIIDGHRMSPDHFAVSGEDALNNPQRDHRYENTPLRLSHKSQAPQGVKDYGKNAEQTMIDNEFYTDVITSTAESYLAPPKPYPVTTYADEFYNEVGEADCSMYTHLKTVLESADDTSRVVEIIARDSDALTLGLWFLYKWQHDMFDDRTSHLPMPTLIHTMGKGWASSGSKDGATNVTAAYHRLVKYRFNGNAHCIPDIICAIISCKSDYTFGYYHVSMDCFVSSFYKYNFVRHEDHHTPFEGPYLQGLVKITTPVRDADGKIVESGTILLDGVVYRRLVNCVFYERYQPRMTKVGYLSPMQAPLHITRQVVNELSNKQFGPYVDDPRSNPMYLPQFEKMLEAFKKRLPPDTEIAKRAMLVQYMLLVLNQVGNKVLVEPDPELFGFVRGDQSKPLSRFNIKYQASFDYEDRRTHWNRMQKRVTLISDE